jgi:hypothetical protein
MNDERPTWQLAGRAAGRSFVDVLLRHGVALIGPGDAGPWSPERDDDEFEGGFVRRFAAELQVGDVLILRSGASRISAVGLVASAYLHLDAFDDVVGLDLQHARRVRWCELPTDYDFGEPVFGPTPARFSRAQSAEVRDYVRRFLNSPPTYWQEAPLPALPEEEPSLEVIPPHLQDAIATANDLHPLFQDRDRLGSPPSEDEMVGHLVLPFLRALGWPPERTGVKWRYIDVCLFRSLPRSPETCLWVIEAKRLGAGVENALDQARGYVQALGEPRDIVVTDGVRYRMYAAEKDYAPVAYANLVRLKRSATELFSRLTRP